MAEYFPEMLSYAEMSEVPQHLNKGSLLEHTLLVYFLYARVLMNIFHLSSFDHTGREAGVCSHPSKSKEGVVSGMLGTEESRWREQ